MAASQVLLVLIIGLALPSELLGKPPKKIINGSNANIIDHPFMVSIRLYNQHFCGGALITRHHVLTAAHCVTDYEYGPLRLLNKNDFSIVTGTSNSRQPRYVYGISKIDVHPGFTGVLPEFLDDIAVITLKSDIVPNAYQNIVRLPTSDVYGGTYATVTGWGYTVESSGIASEFLKRAPVITMNNNDCNRRTPTHIYRNQVCGFYKDTVGFCNGDSGGPLVSYGVIVGLVSISWGCGKGYPDAYTRVFGYMPWIQSKIYN